jgi:formylglycine-generating enzyme required for sulfatase activity
MVPVPGGSFLMGSDENGDSSPSHSVTLSMYKIDKYEVTYAQYDSCVKKGICTKPHYDDGKCYIWTNSGIKKATVPLKYRSPDYPVVCVTWHQARQYCRYKGKRLPTEAEWEYAALAGTQNKYSTGNSAQPNSSIGKLEEKKSPSKTGSCLPNDWGIHDMTGNVWEWTKDRYEKDYYEVSDTLNPQGPKVGRFRVIRGGGWYSTEKQLEVKYRQWFTPEAGEVSIGIRCAK